MSFSILSRILSSSIGGVKSFTVVAADVDDGRVEIVDVFDTVECCWVIAMVEGGRDVVDVVGISLRIDAFSPAVNLSSAWSLFTTSYWK